VDILVNNAGITRDMLVMMMKPDDFTSVINLNLVGPFFCAQAAFMSSMMGQKRGRIVNVASIVGQIGNPGQANYAAAKGGVIGMTRALAKEFGGRGIYQPSMRLFLLASPLSSEVSITQLSSLTRALAKEFGGRGFHNFDDIYFRHVSVSLKTAQRLRSVCAAFAEYLRRVCTMFAQH
jgi:3-oxoacyl-[acyl-carrier protein] reductase